ncbi:hypothetical protein J2Z65_003799 [Paenibacillus aceris]|uniref:Uncharacterized protein n=1 Tax=Paenibacillus aceris TaxID=869555 RepID=A0ABS4I0X8_9BACL|nr:hypothetical protein [Paenibacillus aceris]
MTKGIKNNGIQDVLGRLERKTEDAAHIGRRVPR